MVKKTTYPPVLHASGLATSENEYLVQLREEGFTVIPNVLTENECDTAIDGIWNWLGSLNMGILRDEPESWGASNWITSIHGIVKNYSVGQADFMWDIRTHRRVKEVYERIWNTTDLVTSFDGACVMRPFEQVKRCRLFDDPENVWLHSDQSPYTQEDCIQGFVNLEEAGVEDGCFKCYPKSHLLAKDFWDSISEEKWTKENWYRLNEMERQWYLDRGCSEIRVPAGKGSMVLWNSKTIHSNAFPLKTRSTPRWRYVAYVSMMPREFLVGSKKGEQISEKRKNAVMTGRTSSHWSNHRFSLNSAFPRTYGKDVAFPPLLVRKWDEIPQSWKQLI